MAQDSIGPASFFDVSSRFTDSKSSDANAVNADKGSQSDFSQVLRQTSDKKSNRQKESFFPARPMESRDAESVRRSSGEEPRPSEQLSASTRQRPLAKTGANEDSRWNKSETAPEARRSIPATLPAEDDQEQVETIDSSEGWQNRDPWLSRMAPEVDDRSGTIGRSYDGAVVSYPVSRVAQESLDEKTKDALQKQGLWNLSTVVMAQPNQQLTAFKNVVSEKEGNALPVQKPIAQFMASLENELGISPDRLVQAFQNLPPGQLQLPPERTMALVVKQLGLKGEDQVKAMSMYTKMLAQMRASDTQKPGQVLPPEFLAAGLEKSQKANGGTPLNQSSVQQEVSKEESAPLLNGRRPEVVERNSLNTKVSRESLSEGQSKTQATQTESKIDLNAYGKGQDFKDSFSQQQAKPGSEGSLLSDSQGQQSLSQFQGQNQSENFGSAKQDAFKKDGAVSKNAPAKEGLKVDLKQELKGQEVAPSGKTTVDFNSVANNQIGEAKPHFQNGNPVVAGSAATEMKADSTQQKHEAIQSIINNAQMLAHKGGGEMQMTLRPGDMGEIQLKVAMEGKHVDVQMVTDRGEVKKLIEQSVHELRHGLAQHDLSMNKLEVSVGDKNTGGMKQGMPDFSAAREFAGRSNQQNGRREMLNELSALNSSRSGSGTAEVPRAMSSAARTQAYTRGLNSGRLNVVA